MFVLPILPEKHIIHFSAGSDFGNHLLGISLFTLMGRQSSGQGRQRMNSLHARSRSVFSLVIKILQV